MLMPTPDEKAVEFIMAYLYCAPQRRRYLARQLCNGDTRVTALLRAIGKTRQQLRRRLTTLAKRPGPATSQLALFEVCEKERSCL
jgi:hypothetical protein